MRDLRIGGTSHQRRLVSWYTVVALCLVRCHGVRAQQAINSARRDPLWVAALLRRKMKTTIPACAAGARSTTHS